MFHDTRELETPSLPRFVSLRNPLRNFPILWHRIGNSGPSLDLWTQPSLSANSLSYGSVSVNGVQDKANLLNEYFAACFNSTFVPSTFSHMLVTSEASIEDALNRYDCANQETEILLRGIKPHSATGPDGVTSWRLRSFSEDIAPSVSSLFNLSIRVGRIPSDWKLSHVVPIPKGSSCHDIQSFRPISLLSILSKCLEKHLYQLLLEHFESNYVLSDS